MGVNGPLVVGGWLIEPGAIEETSTVTCGETFQYLPEAVDLFNCIVVNQRGSYGTAVHGKSLPCH
jgi:hypothetical protein